VLDADAAHARETYAGAWRLVLSSAQAPSGTCLLRVRLSVRPNTASGWVRASRVRTAPTPWRIVVSRQRRSVTLLRAGHITGRWRAVVGTSGTPTPRGIFAVDAAYRLRPGGFVGAWVLTLTAHSDVLTTFDGGDGRVALHGRGGASLADPLGTAASHGCIRLTDPAIGAIVHRIGRARVPGTPVVVR
jgi:lipoprotein-anchoring transpeptidase ErfK/SrfK